MKKINPTPKRNTAKNSNSVKPVVKDEEHPLPPVRHENDKSSALSKEEIAALKEQLEEMNRSNALGG